MGLRLSGPLPDETTILNGWKRAGGALMEEINRHLASQGLRLREGTIVDRIIEAPVDEEWRWRARPTDASGRREMSGLRYTSGWTGDGSGACMSTTSANVQT